MAAPAVTKVMVDERPMYLAEDAAGDLVMSRATASRVFLIVNYQRADVRVAAMALPAERDRALAEAEAEGLIFVRCDELLAYLVADPKGRYRPALEAPGTRQAAVVVAQLCRFVGAQVVVDAFKPAREVHKARLYLPYGAEGAPKDLITYR